MRGRRVQAAVVLAVLLAVFPVWLALVLGMLLIGAVVSNNDVGFDDYYTTDDDDYDDNDDDFDDDDDDDDDEVDDDDDVEQ